MEDKGDTNFIQRYQYGKWMEIVMYGGIDCYTVRKAYYDEDSDTRTTELYVSEGLDSYRNACEMFKEWVKKEIG